MLWLGLGCTGSRWLWLGWIGSRWLWEALGWLAIAVIAISWLRAAQADHRAAGGASGAQPAEGLEQGEVLAQLPGLKPPGGSQFREGHHNAGAARRAQLQMAKELGDAQCPGGAGRPQPMGAGMALQGVVGGGEGLAVHCKELQSHRSSSDRGGYPERFGELLGSEPGKADSWAREIRE